MAKALTGTIPLLQGGLTALFVACLLQWPIAERIIERRIRTSLGLLEGVVERAVEECLGQAVVSAPEQVLGEILERYRDFEHLREDAKRVLSEPRGLLSSPELPDADADEKPPVRRTRA